MIFDEYLWMMTDDGCFAMVSMVILMFFLTPLSPVASPVVTGVAVATCRNQVAMQIRSLLVVLGLLFSGVWQLQGCGEAETTDTQHAERASDWELESV